MAHFATFPPALIEPMILAGTSAKGVCAACGAPWRRTVEREPIDLRRHREVGDSIAIAHGPDGRNGRRRSIAVETTGWQTGCTCDADIVPATILDPFGGSMTTGLVALRHGRSFIGIDLSDTYVDMGRKRLVGDAPLLNNVTIEHVEPARLSAARSGERGTA